MDGEANNQFGNNTYNDNQEETITKRLHMVCTMLIVLAFGRFFILDIFSMISDIITAFVIYFTYITRNNFMAVLSLLNGIIGILVTIAKGISDMNQLFMHTGFFRFMFILVFIYSIIVYFLVIFYSYKAMNIYKGFSGQMGGQPGGNFYSNAPSSNYGAVNNNTRAGYVPFSGRGTTIGGTEA
jgi:hypothetical protein